MNSRPGEKITDDSASDEVGLCATVSFTCFDNTVSTAARRDASDNHDCFGRTAAGVLEKDHSLNRQ